MPPYTEGSSRPRLSQACAECRRLKLKCDKNKPCSSCIRRGCASICPQGRMVSKGSRFILANTEQLHEKIDALVNRVRHLEGALDVLQTRHYKERHPLLSDELLMIATPLDTAAVSEVEPPSAKESDELTENMGTLTLAPQGSRYFGSTGAYTYLWRDEEGVDPAESRTEGAVAWRFLQELPGEISHMALSFPVPVTVPFRTTNLGEWMLDHCLPPYPEAWSLFENYWEHYAWHFTPFTRDMFVQQIMSPIYRRSPDIEDKPLGHRLGLLFIVFAMGDILNLTQTLEPTTGLRYYYLARASLCIDPVFESPTVTALQALYLMGVFLMMSRGTSEPEHSWVVSGINLKLALTLGLQHDANKFSLSPDEVENRQYTAISVVATEVWQALSVGRPPSLTFSSFDWVFPPADEKSDFTKSGRYWAACFIRDCSSQVLEIVVGQKAVTYSTILQLDVKIREYPPFHSPVDNMQQVEETGIGSQLLRAFIGMLKEVSLLFLHRRCFALALKHYHADPLKSPFSASVLACHRSACNFISKLSVIHFANKGITLRLWFVWPNVFVATLILGSIVARSPGCSLAPSALMELETASRIWESTGNKVCGPKVLATLRELKEKAVRAFAQNKIPRDPRDLRPGGIEVTDEIHALGGGGNRVISTPKTSSTSSPSSSAHSPEQVDASYNHNQICDASPSRCFDDSQGSPSSSSVDASYNNTLPYAYNGIDNSYPSDRTMDVPFEFSDMDFSSQIPNHLGNTLPGQFNELFGTPGEQGTHQQAPAPGSSILEELGLGSEWGPVMKHLGL